MDTARRSVGGVKGVEGRTSIGYKSSSGNSSSSSSSSSKFNQPGAGDRFHAQHDPDGSSSLEWSGSGSLSASTMNYCNIYINTSSSSGSASASLESGMDDTALLPYLSIAALPSKSATRHFCSVCGYFGTYTCTRCGCRFCCTKCLASHKETRCLKFSY
jgi:HIT zinc finger